MAKPTIVTDGGTGEILNAIGELKGDLSALRGDLITMERRLDERFESMDKKIDDLAVIVESYAKGTNERLERLEAVR
jgi:hypothetical protein